MKEIYNVTRYLNERAAKYWPGNVWEFTVWSLKNIWKHELQEQLTTSWTGLKENKTPKVGLDSCETDASLILKQMNRPLLHELYELPMNWSFKFQSVKFKVSQRKSSGVRHVINLWFPQRHRVHRTVWSPCWGAFVLLSFHRWVSSLYLSQRPDPSSLLGSDLLQESKDYGKWSVFPVH